MCPHFFCYRSADSPTPATLGAVGLSLVWWWASPQSYDDMEVLARKREQGCTNQHTQNILLATPTRSARPLSPNTTERSFRCPANPLLHYALHNMFVCYDFIWNYSSSYKHYCTLYRTSCNSNTTWDPFDLVSSQILLKIRSLFLTRGDRTVV